MNKFKTLPESPEGTPPPVPPYRGSSPELHSSLSTLPLVKVNSPESIACGPTGASYYGSQPVPPEDPAPPNLPPRPPAKPPAKVTGKHVRTAAIWSCYLRPEIVVRRGNFQCLVHGTSLFEAED
ncbi:hypothetical protein GBAR_LOCUS13698 [Geodia barretti]|uniref:Uncharacterized protein n=1 Tax=Geodia barretti TaxID=519541 RepID=A0AA35S756_GEOBA|nr:hypothetical protein GBAR_LOCUS13698 [Geodia barretti]